MQQLFNVAFDSKPSKWENNMQQDIAPSEVNLSFQKNNVHQYLINTLDHFSTMDCWTMDIYTVQPQVLS